MRTLFNHHIHDQKKTKEGKDYDLAHIVALRTQFAACACVPRVPPLMLRAKRANHAAFRTAMRI
jgi:hypothetical protein